MPRFADSGQQTIRADEPRRHVVLHVLRQASLAGAVAVGDVHFPVVARHQSDTRRCEPSGDRAGASSRPVVFTTAVASASGAPTITLDSPPARR